MPIPSDKIKRSFIWLRKVLEITEKTTLPGQILGEVRPTLDTFGWDRYGEAVASRFTGTNSSTATSTVVPEGICRLVTNASVHVDNGALAFTLWLEVQEAQRGGLGAFGIGIVQPVLNAAAGIPFIKMGITRPLLLGPGDAISGHCQPASGAGQLVVLSVRAIDLPIGEYVPPT